MKICIELDSLSLTQQRDIYLVLKDKFENPLEVKSPGKNLPLKTVLQKKLADFPGDFKPKVTKILSAGGITTIGDLRLCTESNICNMRGLSIGYALKFGIFLGHFGLTLKKEK